MPLTQTNLKRLRAAHFKAQEIFNFALVAIAVFLSLICLGTRNGNFATAVLVMFIMHSGSLLWVLIKHEPTTIPTALRSSEQRQSDDEDPTADLGPDLGGGDQHVSML